MCGRPLSGVKVKTTTVTKTITSKRKRVKGIKKKKIDEKIK